MTDEVNNESNFSPEKTSIGAEEPQEKLTPDRVKQLNKLNIS